MCRQAQDASKAAHLNEMRSGGWVWVQLYLIFYQVGMKGILGITLGIYFVNTRTKNRVLGMGMGTWMGTVHTKKSIMWFNRMW